MLLGACMCNFTLMLRSKDKYLYIWSTHFITYEPSVYPYLQAMYIATTDNPAFGNPLVSFAHCS